MELWNSLNVGNMGSHVEINAQYLGLMPLLKDILLKEQGHLSEIEEEGYIDLDDDAPSTFLKYSNWMLKNGGRLVYKHINGVGDVQIFIWKDGMVELSFSGTYLSVKGLSHNESLLQELKTYLDDKWVTPERAGHIYAIIKQGSHLSMSSIGNAGISLVSGNYTPAVIEDYKFVIRDLQSESPSGRITIMRGSPGTGKTHLIRAMLLEVPDAMFVLISPEMVTNLAGPELLPLLLNNRSGTTGPIALILEDADKCLVARDKENMNSIQSLLNLGDGILGSMLDLRIIATTNAKELHMEEAIMRPGRLSKMMEVGPLDPLTAQKIFNRLCPNQNFPVEINGSTNPNNFKMTLAEAYALARKHGWVSNPRKKEVEVENEDD